MNKLTLAILTLLMLFFFTSCKEEDLLDQMTKETTVSMIGDLVFIGSAPFPEPALRVEGLNYPIFLVFEDPTDQERLSQVPQYSLVKANGSLEKDVKMTADGKHQWVTYYLNATSYSMY